MPTPYWRIVFSKPAAKQFAKLDKQTQKAIARYLDKIQQSSTPTQFGKSLTGSLASYWRYRVGKYRIICDIHDHTLIIEVITINKRDKVYK